MCFYLSVNMASSSTNKVTMKLLIDTKTKKVLFAEASKPVIDFLFNLLCLPLGTVVRLLNKNDMVGSLGNLYQSVENLGEIYMQPYQDKNILLKPKVPISSSEISGLLPPNDIVGSASSGGTGTLGSSSFFMCPGRSRSSHCNSIVTCDSTTLCAQCLRPMNAQVILIGKEVGVDQGTPLNKSGFVKEIVTFMVMDDLVIEPMSTISSITLLNKFNVKDVGVLQEKVVELGMAEGIKILKASLESKTVLTSVFVIKTEN